MRSGFWVIPSLAAAGLMMAGVAVAEPAKPADRQTQVVAGNCLLCHGTAAAEAGGMPLLNGLDPKELAAAFREFRDGKRHGTIMPRIAKGYDDATIDAVSAYLAAAQQ